MNIKTLITNYQAMNSQVLAIQPSKVIKHHSANADLSHIQMDVEPVKAPSGQDVLFEDDAPVDVESVPRELRIHTLDSDVSDAFEFDQIKRALERPYILQSGNFSSTDSASTFNNLPWHNPLYAAPMSEKINGVFTITADIVYKLEVNANPFQQGLYSLAFLYSGGIPNGYGQYTNWRLMHRYSKHQIVTLPIAYLNLGCETSVTLRVPWKNCATGYFRNSVNNGFLSPGEAFIYPMVPLTAPTGSTTASYTLWCWYENIVLGAPTVPQMGAKPRRRAVDLLASEQNDKPVSRTLGLAAQISGHLANVPLLTPICTPLSWMLEAGANFAQAFGFSKPNVISQPCRMVRSYLPYSGVADGADVSEPLSLAAGNHVEFSPEALGSDLDEMSLSFIAQQEGYFNTFNWTTAQTTGTTVFNDIAGPIGSTTVNDGTVVTRNYQPMQFVNCWFNLWRGSMVYTIKFVKTKFHSGRLMFAIAPTDSTILGNTNPSLTITTANYAFRNIIDVREVDEIEITVPYIAQKPWCDSASSAAYVGLYVLDPLTAPASVSSTIQVFVTVRAGPDIAFASPRAFNQVPIVPSAFQMDVACATKKTIVGGSTVVNKSLEAAALTTGEVCSSLRQLVKRYMPPMSTSLTVATTNTYTLLPFSSYYYTSNGTVVSGTQANVSRDIYSHLMSIYALSRGGCRVALLPASSNTTQSFIYSLDHVNKQAGNLASLFTSNVESIGRFLFDQVGQAFTFALSTNPDGGVFIPQNTSYISRLNGMNIITSALAQNYSTSLSEPSQLLVKQNGGSAVDLMYFRAGADDCGFGCFVSIPPYYQDTAPA